jgi:hypothetical protein
VVDDIDLSSICRNNDVKELIKLMELIIGAAIKCDNKEVYIRSLMNCDSECQTDLSFLIEKVMKKLEEVKVEEKP